MGRTKKKTKRKNENRYVLDVKLRTDDLRKQRVRVASSILTVVFGTLFILFVAWRGVDWALDEFVYQNPAFAIHKFETQTDGSLAVPLSCNGRACVSDRTCWR